ncbi:hypothetical protein ACFV9C_01405 [Kribbella sp. NPDC059898]|uniref:hypothetical protein n=1 Tax=Kribbella sp. NPDC059898 TaxID=3346995 RepID=UPI0036569FF1
MVADVRELFRQQAAAAVKVAGAHHSSWTGTWKYFPDGDQRHGVADWDHTIYYHREEVVDTLQEMFDRAGSDHSDYKLRRYRDVVRLVLHENIHLLAERGTSHAMGFDAFKRPGNKVVEEATTERAAQNLLDQYIDELGLEAVAPGITSVETDNAYGQWVPAIDSFAAGVADRTGVAEAEVIRRMAVVNSENKLRVAAEMLYDSTLRSALPEQARARTLDELVADMEQPFAQIEDCDPQDPLDRRLASLAGADAVSRADARISELLEYWNNNQDLRRSLDAGLGSSIPPTALPQRESGASRPAEPDDRRPESRSVRPTTPPRGIAD